MVIAAVIKNLGVSNFSLVLPDDSESNTNWRKIGYQSNEVNNISFNNTSTGVWPRCQDQKGKVKKLLQKSNKRDAHCCRWRAPTWRRLSRRSSWRTCQRPSMIELFSRLPDIISTTNNNNILKHMINIVDHHVQVPNLARAIAAEHLLQVTNQPYLLVLYKPLMLNLSYVTKEQQYLLGSCKPLILNFSPTKGAAELNSITTGLPHARRWHGQGREQKVMRSV